MHLALRPGRNLALLNALLREVVARDAIDHAYVAQHTVGYADLDDEVKSCAPEWAAEICGLQADEIRAAAELLAGADRLLSTVLQGVYQAN